MNKAFVNGEFVDLADAKISIFDRGFLFGDSIYEVMPVYNGKPYFMDRHLARLKSSCDKAKIPFPDTDWEQLAQTLIDLNGKGNLQIYLQITRGNQGVRKHDIPEGLQPSVIAFTLHHAFPTLQEKEKGLHAKLIEDIRWLNCDIKTTSLIANILLNDDAVSAGTNTAILSRNGIITEGSASNVFLVDNQGLIKTPVLNKLCLPGITRQIALELIKELEWDVLETDIKEAELFAASEVWITSTTKEIFPITTINNCTIGTGRAGKYWSAIDQKYRSLIG